MQKVKLSILVFFMAFGLLKAQNFVEPFSDFVSEKECYVITKAGEKISGYLKAATDERGYITRLAIEDELGSKYKFRAADVKRFAIRPGVFSKLSTVNEKGTSIRHIVQTDHNDILDREWIIFDQQAMPRTKNRVALLQLLNPGFDQYVKVYDHPNGSKSMPIKVLSVPVVGGEERTFWVVRGDNKPVIVRKSKFKKAFKELFADEPLLVASAKRKPKFKDFAKYIDSYNQLKSGELSAKR